MVLGSGVAGTHSGLAWGLGVGPGQWDRGHEQRVGLGTRGWSWAAGSRAHSGGQSGDSGLGDGPGWQGHRHASGPAWGLGDGPGRRDPG